MTRDVVTQSTQPVATSLVTLQRYPTFFHGRTVSLIGSPQEVGGIWRLPLDPTRTLVILPREGRLPSRSVELRGVLFDVGQMAADDTRLSASGVRAMVDSLSPDRWPPRNTLFALTSATWADPAPLSPASVRAVVLHPEAFDRKSVTLRGRFRAQNLYGDLPAWPRQSQWDFVLQAADASIWVTGLRPRGRGLDLDPTTRRGAGTWLEATGIVRFEDGLARLEASAVAPGAPDADEPAPVATPPPSLPPPALIFSTPLNGESDIDPGAVVRVQFSRDMREASFEGALKITYGSEVPDPVPPFALRYLPDTRSIEIRFKSPLAAGAAVTVSLGPPAAARDGTPLTPASITFRTKR
jgi:Big-like domain-containing protein